MMTYSEERLRVLEGHARQLRIDSLEMIHRRQAGHPGGSLSAADIVAALFFEKLRIDPARPDWPERDRLILSKGHASALLYTALARRGFFPVEDLERWGELSCHLQGHPDRLKTPGVDMTSGILGHGVAIGAGLALAARMAGGKQRVYVLMGDGECQGGIVWEGAMLAARYHLARLTAIVDYNNVQLDGAVHEVMPLEPFGDKWRAFNWAVLEINGHNMRQILEALDTAEEIHDRPTLILARTTKGKGVSFMENDSRWHGIAPDAAQLTRALAELRGERAQEVA
jgi:transketolase